MDFGLISFPLVYECSNLLIVISFFWSKLIVISEHFFVIGFSEIIFFGQMVSLRLKSRSKMITSFGPKELN